MTAKKKQEEQASEQEIPTKVVDTQTTAVATPQNHYLEVFTRAQARCVTKLQSIAEDADEEGKKGIARLIKSAQPVVKGREEMASNWNIPTVRIVYGTTKDPARPSAARVGDMYATSGLLIKAPFVFTPLYIYEANRMFQEESSAPMCWAPDAKLGTTYGLCTQCLHLPMGKNATGERTDCNNGVTMIVLSQDYKLYRLEFYKTSRKAGASVDRLVQSQEVLWERWFELSSNSVQSKTYEYYVFKTAPQGTETDDTVQKAADTLYDLIKAERDVFLERHYQQAAQDETASTPAEQSVDEAAMGIAPDAETNPTDLTSGDL